MKSEYVYQTKTPEQIRDLWQTPPEVFNYWNSSYKFKLDVAASEDNHLCEDFYTKEDNAIDQDWDTSNWCNPPYSEIGLWVDKSIEELNKGNKTVMLVPQSMDTKWFTKAFIHCKVVLLVGGRIHFIRADTKEKVAGNTKGSMFLIFDKDCNCSKITTLNIGDLK